MTFDRRYPHYHALVTAFHDCHRPVLLGKRQQLRAINNPSLCCQHALSLFCAIILTTISNITDPSPRKIIHPNQKSEQQGSKDRHHASSFSAGRTVPKRKAHSEPSNQMLTHNDVKTSASLRRLPSLLTSRQGTTCANTSSSSLSAITTPGRSGRRQKMRPAQPFERS